VTVSETRMGQARYTEFMTLPLEVVDAACAEAPAHNVHSAGAVLNIFARHREQPPPLTFTTPDACG